MALSPYVRLAVGLEIDVDSDGEESLFDKKVRVARAQLSDKEVSSGVMKVADSVNNQSIPMGGVGAGEILYVESDEDISVRTNDSETVDVVAGKVGTGSSGYLLRTGAFSTADVSNSSGSVATVQYCVLGEDAGG
jgi:hypothetical protein